MKLNEFIDRLTDRAMYETMYDDTEGREILVIRTLDLFAFVNRLLADEREACAKVCEEHWEIDGTHTAKEFASYIRARGQA